MDVILFFITIVAWVFIIMVILVALAVTYNALNSGTWNESRMVWGEHSPRTGKDRYIDAMIQLFVIVLFPVLWVISYHLLR